MNTYGVYKVTGQRLYRGHAPGTIFEAVLDPAAERRAILRGDIALQRRVRPSLEPGSFTLPKDWLKPVTEATRGAERRLTR